MRALWGIDAHYDKLCLLQGKESSISYICTIESREWPVALNSAQVVKVTTLRNTSKKSEGTEYQWQLNPTKRGGYILPATKNKQLLIILNSAQVVKVTTLRNTEEERKEDCVCDAWEQSSVPAERGGVEDSRYAPGHMCNMLCILADKRGATLQRFVLISIAH